MRKLRTVARWLSRYIFDSHWDEKTPLRPVGRLEHALVVIVLLIVLALGLWLLASLGHGG